jgi:lipopolysaccharide/colanic/teichoic acid biosynthesis glycosyltransferase
MRFFDFIVALIGLLIFSPLFLVIAILIKLSSSGSIIYSQERVGLNGKLFRLYKFRSMVANADKIGTSVTSDEDPRITKIGRFLRKTKLDELPQLWNVLKGDMSLVGPRPDVPEVVNTYSPEMRRILEVRPGITGTAALYLINEEELLALAHDPDRAYEEIFIPAKIKLSMEHVTRKSIWFNLSIIIKTMWALTGGKIFPLKEHPVVEEIKRQIINLNGRVPIHQHKMEGAKNYTLFQ